MVLEQMPIITAECARWLRLFTSIVLIYLVFLRALLAPLPASAAPLETMGVLCLTQSGETGKMGHQAPARPDLPQDDISCCDEACLTLSADFIAPKLSASGRAYGTRPDLTDDIQCLDWPVSSTRLWRLTTAPGAPRAPPANMV